MFTNNLNVGGLPVNVYSTGVTSSKPVVVLFVLHGRTQKSEDYIFLVNALLAQDLQHKRRDLYVVTFDHRNHGHRMVDANANEGWSKEDGKGNEKHAIDMYTIQTGTALDVSFLIDFLPAYLFPNGERTIEEWGVAGVSLGGHSTWISLARGPRVSFGVPIIGCPDFMKLMTGRAEEWGKTPFAGSKYLPKSIVKFIEEFDPAKRPFTAKDSSNPFIGKKILVLSGAADELVPWYVSESFFEGLEVGIHGSKRVVVEEGVGHRCSEKMVVELVNFVVELL